MQKLLEFLIEFTLYRVTPDPLEPQTSWIGAAIIGASALISGLLANRKSKKERELAKSESELAYQREVEMIDKQNEYNSPANQMERYGEAGLNPNLIYSQGQPGQQTQHASYEPQREMKFNAMAIPDLIGMYQNFSMKQAQIDNVKAQTANTYEKTMNEAVRNYILKLQGKRGDIELAQREHTAPYQAAIIGNQARASEAKLMQEWQKLANMERTGQQQLLDQEYKRKAMTAVDLDNEKRQADIIYKKYQNQWAQYGINGSDNILLRILVRMMNDSGFQGDLSPIFK